MGKRSSFERRERDFYPTPREAVLPLIPHLRGVRAFAEPCCGDGALVRHLESFDMRCTYAGDISTGQDALAVESYGGAPVITNSPWLRAVLHPMIAHFMRAAPFAWLLVDADWPHTKQSRPFIPHCSHILPLGRIKWIAGSDGCGKDNAAWYRFEASHTSGPVLLQYRAEITSTAPRRTCEQCGDRYSPQRSDSLFCSPRCRTRAYRSRLAVTQTSP